MPDVGTLRIDIEVENPARPGQRRRVERALVDTGAELSWIPADILEALRVELATRQLIEAGPMPAAMVA